MCDDRACPPSLIILLVVMNGTCNLIITFIEYDYMESPFSLKVWLNHDFFIFKNMLLIKHVAYEDLGIENIAKLEH
jgi:hypothetical protein